MENGVRFDIGANSAEDVEVGDALAEPDTLDSGTGVTAVEDVTDMDSTEEASDVATTEQGEVHQPDAPMGREQWAQLVDSVWDMSHRSVMADHRERMEEQQRAAEARAAVAKSYGQNGQIEG